MSFLKKMFLIFVLHWKEVLSSLLFFLREAERLIVPAKIIPSIRVCAFSTAMLIYDLGKYTLKNLRPSCITAFIYPCLSLRGYFHPYMRRGDAGGNASFQERPLTCVAVQPVDDREMQQDHDIHPRSVLPSEGVQSADDREMPQDYDIHSRLPMLCTASERPPSRDGILIWKITDYMRRKAEEPCLCSQPFYTSHNGYKMQAIVYLNGHGEGYLTHMSFFLVLLKGEYDHLLPWPFQQKITLYLLNQGQGHHCECILPDPNLPSYQRPQSEANMETGYPLFVSQNDLENLNNGYLDNDSIFVKVFIGIQTNNTGHR